MAINTNKLKPFAQKARNILMDGVSQRILFWGFDQNGELIEEPQKIDGGVLIRGKIIDDPTVYSKYTALKSAIKSKGVKQVYEEAAYTWFNRIMAITILAKNGYIQPQMEYGEGQMRTPLILQRARRGQNVFLDTTETKRLSAVINDYEKENDAFAILLIGFCHSHILLKNVFGSIDDYSELLLPGNILAETGFIHLLNTTDAITDNDYKKVELIGWLYQFYISEKKDEVFKKFKDNKKAEKEDIPAATQIFTPNWIVKYMVENTVGQLWLDLNPSSPLREQMKYRVEHAESNAPSEPIIKEISELKLLDPAVGSGHILAEGFDLMFDMYKEELYPTDEAVQSILKNNLFGLDIDKRAVQLAQFAILLKAAQKYPAVIEKGILPQVYDMPEPHLFSRQDVLDFLGSDGVVYEEKLTEGLKLMLDAQNLGSTMIFDLPEDCVTHLKKRLTELKNKAQRNFTEEVLLQNIEPYLQIILILSSKYEAVAANPPYMGSGNMNGLLKRYIDLNYCNYSNDLMTVFMKISSCLVNSNGLWSMINIHTWLTKKEFIGTRKLLVYKQQIKSMLHFGRGVFGSDFGSVSFTIRNTIPINNSGVYRRLFETFVKVENQMIKEQRFFDSNCKIYFTQQRDYLKLPGYQIAYWIKKELFNTIETSTIKSIGDAKQGIKTGDNERFIKNWYEVSFKKSSIADKIDPKWFPLNKGGDFRKWYGNDVYFLNWASDGSEVKNIRTLEGKIKSRPQNIKLFFKIGITWSTSASYKPSFRFSNDQFTFESSGSKFFILNPKFSLDEVICYLNTNVAEYLIDVFGFGKGITEGAIKALPYINFDRILLTNRAKELIEISKRDWNSHEFSWDFQQNPLLQEQNSLAESYQKWKEKVRDDFFQLHTNEEELNRIFIKIYGLQAELKPDVALKDITILQNELDRNKLEQSEPQFREKGKEAIELPVKKDIVIQQLISYAIGCMMGRYRLDKPGLHIAHPNAREEEISEYLVIRGKGLGADAQQAIFKYICNEYQEFSGSVGLAKIHGFSNSGLSDNRQISEGGNVRIDQSAEESSGISSIQHSRRTSKGNQGVSSLFENGQRLSGGSGNTNGDSNAVELYPTETDGRNHNSNNRDFQNVEWLNEQAQHLITNPSSLTPFNIDEDAIIPIMGSRCTFSDDAVNRLKEFLLIVWGEETLTENINFAEACLNKDIESYLVKDFWSYHCKMYSKRPVYWLFSSKKGAFQVLVYMHRMNKFTVEKIRSNYLLKHIQNLDNQLQLLSNNSTSLSRPEMKRLEQLEKDVAECGDYDLFLKDIADKQLGFDLDDGVVANYKLFEGVVARIK